MDKVIKEIAHDSGLDTELITRVVRSQFKFVKDVMEAGEMDSIHLPYFGKIAVKPGRLKKIKENEKLKGFIDNISKSGLSFKKK